MRRHGGCGESEGCSGGGGGDAGSQLQCAFLLTPSDAPNIGLIEMLRGGLISVACAMGARATLRMLQLKDNHARIHNEVMAGYVRTGGAYAQRVPACVCALTSEGMCVALRRRACCAGDGT